MKGLVSLTRYFKETPVAIGLGAKYNLFPKNYKKVNACNAWIIQSRNWASEASTLQTSSDLHPILFNDIEIEPITTENPREAWIESLNPTATGDTVGMMTLHPDVFGAVPRLDIIQQNVKWQNIYRKVNYDHALSVNECRGGGRKPWPQKGTGRARQGSIRAPQWKNGGSCHGPRKYTTKFYMLPPQIRVTGLISTLSCKFAQDDLKIVDSLDIPTDDPKYIEQVCEDKYWGASVLFVDVNDVMPRNITAATDKIEHFNILPAYSLNVLCMLKHETLVLTYKAVQHIQEKLLHYIHRPDKIDLNSHYQHYTARHVKPIGY